MALSAEKLQGLLRAGDTAAIVTFFTGANATERRAVSAEVAAWGDRLILQHRGQFNKKAAAQIEKEGAIGNWYNLLPAAYAAALACGSLSEILAFERLGRIAPDLAVGILGDRRPAWVGEYAEALCARELGRWRDDWKQVRGLVRAGWCEAPKHEHYALAAIESIWPRFERDKPRPDLVDLLLAERDWLETDFWRLFELDGNGEVSLANSAKYSGGKGDWAGALVELSRRGILSRERLLDSSLEALSRDFIQFRAGWFSRFHEALEPTPAERVARTDIYLRLLGSSIPPTVAFAIDAIRIVDATKPLAASRLADALSPALAARGKAVVKTALDLFGAAAKREVKARNMICVAAIPALLHEAPDVQKRVFDLLDKHGDKENAALHEKLTESGQAVAASLKGRLTPWLGVTERKPEKRAADVKIPIAPQAFNPTNPERAVTPITNLDDLIHAAGAALEEPSNPTEIERVLDGVSRLCDQRPEDFERRLGPLRKRAIKKRDAPEHTRRPTLERGLAMFLLTWIDRANGFSEAPEALGRGQNQYAFIFRRLLAISRRAEAKQAMPLLSSPTHIGGWIEPSALTTRWLAWKAAGFAMNGHDQVLALLRLAPEGRRAALAAVKKLEGEADRALRFALGEDQKIGGDAALWLAASRSRQPYGDLAEFEARHPKLGPDAGEAARCVWTAESEHRGNANFSWTRLNLELRTEPEPPKEIGDTLLPVLFHGAWQTCQDDEKPLIRWATQLWPANREAMLAHACKPLGLAVDYADAGDRDKAAYLEILSEATAEFRPMACLALALGLAAQDNALRGHAQDALIAAIQDGRADGQALGATMTRLLDTGINRFARWGKSLREVARVSQDHAIAATRLIEQALRGDPAKAPRDVAALLESFLELLSETNAQLSDPAARDYLTGLKQGGKTGKLVKQILAL